VPLSLRHPLTKGELLAGLAGRDRVRLLAMMVAGGCAVCKAGRGCRCGGECGCGCVAVCAVECTFACAWGRRLLGTAYVGLGMYVRGRGGMRVHLRSCSTHEALCQLGE
jgi:hypothetical protein